MVKILCKEEKEIFNLFSSSIKVGILTFISRIFGYLRDLIITYFFGANFETDAFYVAYRIPNLFRRLLAEGTLSTTLVPFFTEAESFKDKSIFKNLRNNIFTLLFIALLVITSCFYFFSVELINIFAFGFDPKTKELSSDLLKKMSPFLFLISLSALNMGLLNSLKKFNAPAFSPVLMNLGIIFIILISSFYFSLSINILAYAVLFGALLQYLFQIPFILKSNAGYCFSFNDCINPKTKEILGVLFPQIFGLAIYNINILVNTQFASFLQKGSITYLYLAERLIEFPLGIFAVSIATTILPDLSKHFLNKNISGFSLIINEKLKFLIFLSVPFAVSFILLGEDLCNLLYARGEFTVDDSFLTYKALVGYSVGLIFVAGVRLITQGFYAIKNTKLPVRYGGYNLIINFLLCYLLGFYFDLGFYGLALASSISSICLFIFLSLRLKEIFNQIDLIDLVKFLIQIILMSFASIYIGIKVAEFFLLGANLLILLSATVSFSFVIFYSISKFLNLKEIKMIFK
ncbi:murein biosynthesis integral membrane protein MurJ [bacterium]|nr:murein biosynthesis integral membrane protein MurJ [bacterium]